MARKMKTMDGNTAAAHVSYAFTDVAAIYPITPSSPMAEYTDAWAAGGRKNIFGQEVILAEMQSEAGAAGTVHGSLAAGALTTTYTASQGLLLMIPNMYKIAGELLPGVFHVSARALASHALSIFGDHSDIYSARQTGFAMLCSNSVQEVMDLGAVAHLAAIKSRIPFMHFFDGFRTSHEIQKIETWDYEDLKDMVDMDAIDAFRRGSLNPEHPIQRGSAQNPDIFFQAREACNSYYDAVPAIVEDYMAQVNAKIGTDYQLFNYVGAKDAEHIIVCMGSGCEAVEETVDHMIAAGEKVGLVKVRLYRPFSAQHLINAIPDSVKQISVLDRTKEPGAIGEPLYLDVVAALKGSKFDQVPVFTGRYGLGSKDTEPTQILAVYKNTEKKVFTIGINDDLTNLSLPLEETVDFTPKSTISCKFWGLGADGTVGANKNSIKIIGDHTDMYAQAYFSYDSKKSGGVTVSHLRFGKEKIKSTYLVRKANFVACHTPSYINKYNMVQDVKDGGTFLLNCSWSPEELESHIPGQAKRYMAKHNIKFYTIDGTQIGKDVGLGTRINTVLQAAFFKLAEIIPAEDAIKYMKDAATYSYSKKGDDIVKMNHDAIDRGFEDVKEFIVPASWADCADEDLTVKVTGKDKKLVDYINNIQNTVNAQDGDSLPVSAFKDYADGHTPLGSSAFEKRGVAVDVPTWNPDNCIQCNFCSLVCPHASIRPVAIAADKMEGVPEAETFKDMTGLPGYKFAITVSTLDCMGCGSCAQVCPGMKGNKALDMQPIDTRMEGQKLFDYSVEVEMDDAVVEKFKDSTLKGSQFKQPLLQFSGACAGCGETPYAKLVTQLFGDRMYIANATGCSSIWGFSAPTTPFCTTKEGKGPAWGNSLFEDNAEYGFGMEIAQRALRIRLQNTLNTLNEKVSDDAVKTAIAKYFETADDGSANSVATKALVSTLEASADASEEKAYVLKEKDFLSKKSQWIFGGDGWAYDIGYGGVDHVLASGENVNILVFDTEVYSNTGGQASKATPTGAIAKFAAAGKDVKKKDLAAISMSYGYIYVAQIAMGADMNQTLKALKEAEAYNGPSLVIAYAPCVAHGIKGGMTSSQAEEKKAVQSGYWHLFRFNPDLTLEGKNPFTLDSKEPSTEYRDFIMNEVRYNQLYRANPERAEQLFAKAERDAKAKYKELVRRTQD